MVSAKSSSTIFFIFILFSPVLICGIDLQPWYPRDLQFQSEIKYFFQSFHSVDAPKKDSCYSSKDHFLKGSLLAVYSPFSLQLQTEFADTRKRNFDWDNVSLTGRYLWLNDDIGDPFSFTTGLTFSRAWKAAVNDISSFHHGRNEAFLHVALGKQNIQGATWLSRWWGVLGMGTADRWVPWIVANAAYEWNPYNPQRLRLYINSLWGCGKKKLRSRDFGGYGPIDHRSIDVGLRYIYEFDYCGMLYVDYSYRVYAHNFPDHVNRISICFIYPFGPIGDYLLLKAYTLLTGKLGPF